MFMNKVVLSIFLFLCVKGVEGKVEKEISTLCDTGVVNKLEVIYYPEYISTNVSMSVEQLLARYIYKIEINNVQDSPLRNEIVKMLNIDYFEHENANDLRWGVRITSKDNKICDVYFDAFGNCGKINDTNVCFKNNSILAWVKSRVPLFVRYDGYP